MAQQRAHTDDDTTATNGVNILRVMFVGPDKELFEVVEDHLCNDFKFLASYVSSGKLIVSKTMQGAADICLVSAGALGNVSDVVDYCLALRQSSPDLPVILLSANVAMSDFSTERWELCDATVKVPVTRVSLALAVSAALQNNLAFVKMCKDTGRWLDPKEPMGEADPEFAIVLESTFEDRTELLS